MGVFSQTEEIVNYNTVSLYFIFSVFISVSHGGKSDLTKHVSSLKHKNALSASSSCSKLSSFFIKDTAESKTLAAAEATMAYHTVKHHLSYNSTSCSGKLHGKVFSDSKIATKFSSGKTKTEAIVNNVLAPHCVGIVKSEIENVNFVSLSTDASNNRYHKIFPILVQYFDKNYGVQVKLVELDELSDETSVTISEYLLKTIQIFDISRKVVAFGGDNTNACFGGVNRNEGGNNIFTHLKKQLPNGNGLIGVGCPAHVLHNTLQRGADSSNVDVQVIVMKIFNHFSIYSKRVNELKELCDYVSVKYQDLLSHSKTRWLSLLPAIERILKLFSPLKAYFLSSESCPKILKDFFQNELSEAYLWFLHSQMSVFYSSIMKLERERNSICEGSCILDNVINKLKDRGDSNFLSISVKGCLKDKPESLVNSFKEETKIFYSICYAYIQKWMPAFRDLNCFSWMILDEVPEWGNVEKSLEFLIKSGHTLINDSILFDQLGSLKTYVKNELEKDEDSVKIFKEKQADERWVNYFKSCSSSEQFSELLKLTEFYFSIPSHNANVERVFSMINAQWTDERNRLKISSVKSILLLKYNMKHLDCIGFYDYVIKNTNLLSAISKSEKYDFNTST